MVLPLEEQLVDVLLPGEEGGVDDLPVDEGGAPGEDLIMIKLRGTKIKIDLVTGDRSQKRKTILIS